MAAMRALLVLATILSFATPQVSWSAMALSREAPSSWSLAAPGAATQLVHAVASKTDKTFASGFAVPSDRPALVAHFVSIECGERQTSHPPNLDLDHLPLAPRPPPNS
jgi:hypothetical protein